MSLITHQIVEPKIHHIQLNNGSGNPINAQLIAELHQLIQQIHGQEPKALILDSHSQKIFSGGFDLPEIAFWPRAELKHFLQGYLEMIYSIMRLPCVSISVINGHCIAAGFILSLATDFRICTDRSIKLGLSEVNLGPAVPASAQVLFESRTNRRAALWASATGSLFSPQTAFQMGYALKVDSQPLEQALSMAQEIAQKPAFGSGLCSAMLSDRIIEEMRAADEKGMALFLDSWFHDDSQAALQKLALQLSKKS